MQDGAAQCDVAWISAIAELHCEFSTEQHDVTRRNTEQGADIVSSGAMWLGAEKLICRAASD